jgi:hypothetical protein
MQLLDKFLTIPIQSKSNGFRELAQSSWNRELDREIKKSDHRPSTAIAPRCDRHPPRHLRQDWRLNRRLAPGTTQSSSERTLKPVKVSVSYYDKHQHSFNKSGRILKLPLVDFLQRKSAAP